MTRADVFNDLLGPASGGGKWAGSQSPSLFWNDTRYDPAYNTMLLPASEDDRLMATGQAQYQLMDKLFKRTKANQQQREVNFLKSMLAQPDVNIYGKATNPDEAHAQKLIEDYRVGADKGIAAITAAYEYNRDRALKETQLAQARANLRHSILTGQREEGLYPTQRAKAEADLAKARSDIEQAKLDKQSLIAYRNQQSADRQTAMEDRRRQLEFADEQRLADAQARGDKETQTNREQQLKVALDEVKRGVDPNTLVGQLPYLSAEDYMMLDAQAQQANKERQDLYSQSAGKAKDWSQMLGEEIDKRRQAIADSNKPGWLRSIASGVMPGLVGAGGVTPQQMNTAEDRALADFQARNAKQIPPGIRYYPDEEGGVGGYTPNMIKPPDYTPLDLEMLRARGILPRGSGQPAPGGAGFYDAQTPYNFYGQPASTGSGYYGQPTSQPVRFPVAGRPPVPTNPAQIPTVNSQAAARLNSTSPYVRSSASGRVQPNPYWNAGGFTPDSQAPASVRPPSYAPSYAPRAQSTPTQHYSPGAISTRAWNLITRMRNEGRSDEDIFYQLSQLGMAGETGGMLDVPNIDLPRY